MKKNLISLAAVLAALVMACGCVFAEATVSDLATGSDLASATDTASATDVIVPVGEKYTDACGDWYYTVNENGYTVTLTAFRGAAEKVVVPQRINGMRVTVIAEGAFSGNGTMTSVKLPLGVKTVAAGAFKGCTALKTAEISSTVTELGNEAFAACTAMERVFVPGSVQTFGENIFAGNSSLTVCCFLGGAAAKTLPAQKDTFGELKLLVNFIVHAEDGDDEDTPCQHKNIIYTPNWETEHTHEMMCADCGEYLGIEACPVGRYEDCPLCGRYGIAE